MLSTGEEVGKRGIHRSRWRTDGSHYHSILRDGERSTEAREGEITMKKKEGEGEDVARVKKTPKKLLQACVCVARGWGGEVG